MSACERESYPELLAAATRFLESSLEHYGRGDLTFAILHAITCLELVLKQALVSIHPNLIYSNVDAQEIDRSRTVGLRDLPFRLRNLGIPIGRAEAKLIARVRGWRNEIVHHLPTFEHEEATRDLGGLFDLLLGFLARQLSIDIRSFVGRDLYKVLNGIVGEWERLVSDAEQRAQEEGSVTETDQCPNCGRRGVVVRRDRHLAYCHLCRLDLSFGLCSECGRVAFWRQPHVASEFDDEICDDCIEAAGEAWMEQQWEIRRGR